MKKIILLFSLLLFFNSVVFSQLENNNWYFGEFAGLTFSSNPPTPLLNGAMQHFGGCGTVSDKNTGQLLFYTNGINVWNRNNQIMANSITLNGGSFSFQSGLIVPNPANSNQYFVFSIGSSVCYSIVDMSLNSTLGDVIATEKNVLLLNNLGAPFSQISSAITVTKNATGNGFWLLYPNNNKLYSYLIDSTGLHNNPTVTDLNFTNSQNETVSFLSCIKVSPDNSKVGISFFSASGNNSSQMRIYDFNSTTGTIINTASNILINNKSIYSFEFSPNSNLLFINNTVNTSSDLKLIVYDLVNLISREEILPPINGSSQMLLYHFQRGPNDEIYFTNANNNVNYIGKVNNPNDYFSSITSQGIYINPDNNNRTCRLGLPQLIPSLSCLPSITLTAIESNTNFSYQASNSITTISNYEINPTQNINLYAGSYIELKGNTHLKNGSNVLAKIQVCPIALPRQTESIYSKESTFTDKKKLLIAPNPTEGIIRININNSFFNSVSLIGLDGKIIYSKDFENTKNEELDISSISKGMYLLTVKTIQGDIVTEKLIKN